MKELTTRNDRIFYLNELQNSFLYCIGQANSQEAQNTIAMVMLGASKAMQKAKEQIQEFNTILEAIKELCLNDNPPLSNYEKRINLSFRMGIGEIKKYGDKKKTEEQIRNDCKATLDTLTKSFFTMLDRENKRHINIPLVSQVTFYPEQGIYLIVINDRLLPFFNIAQAEKGFTQVHYTEQARLKSKNAKILYYYLKQWDFENKKTYKMPIEKYYEITKLKGSNATNKTSRVLKEVEKELKKIWPDFNYKVIKNNGNSYKLGQGAHRITHIKFLCVKDDPEEEEDDDFGITVYINGVEAK